MARAPHLAADAAPPPVRPAGLRQWLIGLTMAVLALILLATALVQLLNTTSGHRWLTQQLDTISPESGLEIQVGRLEGSLFGRLTIHDLELRDPKGVFLTSARVDLDWDPLLLLRKRLHFSFVESRHVRLWRRPALRKVPRDPDEPFFPDIDIYIGRLSIAQLHLDAPVAGKSADLRAKGSAEIQDGLARVTLDIRAKDQRDHVHIALDAAPDRDRFDLQSQIRGPAQGVLATLLNLQAPIAIDIGGKGTWRQWDGQATGTVGRTPLLNLRLRSREGHFTVRGMAAPNLLTQKLIGRLSAPRTDVDISLRHLDGPRVDIEARLESAAAVLTLRGPLDRQRGRFENLNVRLQLVQPAALRPNLGGRDVALALSLRGALRAPSVAYRLTAPQLRVGTTVIENLYAEGRGSLAQKPVIFSLDARARRVTGVGDVAGGLLTGLALKGPVQWSGGQLIAPGLQLRSDRLSGTASLMIDLATGRYRLGLKGGVMRYAIPGFGLVDVMTDLNVTPENRLFSATGQAQLTGVRIDNRFFAALFEGQPRIDGEILRGSDRILHIRNARLRAPGLQATLNGALLPEQRIDMMITGLSRIYGPFTARLTGSLIRPDVALTIERYNAGIQLSAIEARLKALGRDYDVSARARTAYGPMTLQARLGTATSPTTLDIQALQLAGISARGRLMQASSGPWQGRLLVQGNGLAGSVMLSAAGARQAYDATLGANNATLALATPVNIKRGQLRATGLLGAQSVTDARFEATGVTRDDLRLRSIAGDAQLRNGIGRLTFTTEGTRGVSFALSTSATLQRDSISANIEGNVARQPIKLEAPALVRRTAQGWSLAPVTLILPSGRATVEGLWGPQTRLKAELNKVGLDIVNLFSPALGIAGRASGTVDLLWPAQGGIPRGTARLMIRNFSRAELVGDARAFDVGINATLDGRKGMVRAIFQQGESIFGRAQALISQIPGNDKDPALERLIAAPVNAQVRWAGPAGPLWALFGISAFDVRGPIALDLGISGRLGDPSLTGSLSSQKLQFESTQIGAVLSDATVQAQFNGSRLNFTRFAGKAGGGDVKGSGFIDMSLERGLPMRIDMDLSRALVINRDDLRAYATGPMQIINDEKGARITGDLAIERARFRLGTATAAEFAEILVREKNSELVRTEEGGAPTMWQLDVRAKANNKIEVKGMGLDSEWLADLEIKGPANQPRLSGSARVVRGDYDFAGKTFEIERGSVRFTDQYPPNPVLDISAVSTVEGLTATLRIQGNAQRPEISFASVPALPEDEVISRILFGNSIANLSAGEALQLAGAATALRSGGGGGLDPVGSIRKMVGLDRLRFRSGNERTGEKASVAAGQYLTDRVYVEVAADAEGFAATQIEIQLTRALSILSSVTGMGQNSVNLRWSKDY